MTHELLIGIDGGGTHSTAAAALPDGRIVAVCNDGGLNYHNVGINIVRDRIENMVVQLCRKSSGTVGDICIGMSALDGPADSNTTSLFASHMIQADHLDLQSDAYIALMGFTRGEPGIIVICGTGSMLLMLDAEGNQHVAGGWGYLLNDAGSGYTLAREGLLAAIDYAEGFSSDTALLQEALSYFGGNAPRDLIERIYDQNKTPDHIAGFARNVLSCAQAGDIPALNLLTNNMKRLALQTSHLLKKAPEANHIGLYGGIFAHSELARHLFTEELYLQSPTSVVAPLLDYPPELGAIIHLFKKRGVLTDAILSRLKSSYKEYCHECR